MDLAETSKSSNKDSQRHQAKSSNDSHQSKSSQKRLTVSLPPETVEMLELLSDLQHISFNEAIRRAISTEAFLQGEIRQDSKLMLKSADGEIKELIFR
jgi:predicted HicB family RNase H-like nuclease